MSRLEFRSSPSTTLGVEIEVAVVDAETMALRSGCPQILERLPEHAREGIKHELMQCYIEVNSKICTNARAAEDDLREKFSCIEDIAEDLGLRYYWSATHPFSSWHDQEVTANSRYANLVQMMQDTARQLVTFGLHVHVGVDSGDKAVMVCDRMLRHLPTLLAASCNSPFWEGRVTGLASWRSRVMDGLPTAGLPPLMRNWSEYVWLINHLVETGYIESIREIWWDMRPHHNFGTVEVRICDVPGSLEDATALAALVHCLVKRLSDDIDNGTYQHDCHPMMVRQNKWQAARYGLEAQLVDSNTYTVHPARDVVRELVRELLPTAQDLDCSEQLERVLALAEQPNWSRRQLDILNESHDPAEVVRRMTEHSKIRAAK